MFRLLGRKQGAKDKDKESKVLEESQGAEAVEAGGDGDGKKLADLLNELAEQRGASSAASVRSIIKAAINSAQQIVDAVKMRAVEEAQQEAIKILIAAKREADRIKEARPPVKEKTGDDIIPGMAKFTGERAEETSHTQEKAVATNREEVRIQPTVTRRTVETEPQQEETVSVEPVVPAAVSGKADAGEKAEEKKPEMVLTKTERESLYTGEVELAVAAPLEPTMVSKLYNYLQTTPEIKFVRTTGSWNKGSSITILLDKSIPLLSVLAARLPEADVVPERPEAEGQLKDKRRGRKIHISLRKK